MSTTRLYYTDSYLTSFEARVVDVADEGRRLYLDRTAFYPTSGGQAHDLGNLNGVRITDVIDEGERIAHVLESPLDATRVAGEVQWERRFDHMQQHTGQHLLSAVLEDAYGFHTVSVHFGRDYSSLDLDVDSVTAEQIVAAETRANLVIAENRPVTTTFEDAATATGLRKESGRTGPLRIVTISELDRSACGGTHVRATGEIGGLLIRKVERVRKSARLDFFCGLRAVRRARADFEALTKVAGALSASLDDAATLVSAQGEQLRAAENERRKLERELAGHRAKALYDAATPDERGRRVVRHEGASMDELRAVGQAIVALPSAVLVGTVGDPPSLLLAAAEDTGMDAGRTLREVVMKLGGRGGGSPRVAQGTVPDKTLLNEAVTTVLGDR